jgi:hypothetical protein
MAELTKAKQIVMAEITDWCSPHEVARKHGYDNPGPASRSYGKMLAELHRAGLAEWHQPNNTYRLSAAGRSALSTLADGGESENG